MDALARNDIRAPAARPACGSSEDPELFFPDNDTPAAAEPAKAICRRCPKEVLSACVKYALTYSVEGIWGGTTETDRDLIRERHGLTAQPIVETEREVRTEAVQQLTQQQGLTANEIARRLGITPRTVQRHRRIMGEKTA